LKAWIDATFGTAEWYVEIDEYKAAPKTDFIIDRHQVNVMTASGTRCVWCWHNCLENTVNAWNSTSISLSSRVTHL
jgi:hypothetical protein